MPILDYLFGFSAEAPSIFPHDPNDPRAWQGYGGNREIWGGHSGPSSVGAYIQPDDAIGVSCVFMALQIWAGAMGASPIRFYRELPKDEGTQTIFDYPLRRVLGWDGKANPWQTAIKFRMWAECQRRLWGLCLADIKWGGRGLELWPIEAEHVTKIDQIDAGYLRFEISEPGKPKRDVMQDQVLYLEGFGTHKNIPESLLRRCREAVGVWLAQQSYRGAYFERGAAPSIIFQHPGEMSEPAQKRFKANVQGRVGGLRNAHKTLVIEEAMTVKEFGDHARNAQLVEAWDAQAMEVARWFSVHPYMLGVDVGLPYASRESAAREWVNLHAGPCARMTEASFKDCLIVEDEIGCEILLDHLTQGDSLVQAQVAQIRTSGGITSRNEERKNIGLNPHPDPAMDKPERTANLGTDNQGSRGGDPRKPSGPDNPGDQQRAENMHLVFETSTSAYGPVSIPSNLPVLHVKDKGSGPFVNLDGARFESLAREAAASLLQQEVSPIRRHAPQYASNPQQWGGWLTRHYRQHADRMAKSLALPVAQVIPYTERHRDLVLAGGIAVCEAWEGDGNGVAEMLELGAEK